MPTPAEHIIGFPRESTPGDRRTLLTPRVACVLREAGFSVVAEPGIGAGVFGDDTDLAAEGVRIAGPDEVWAAPLVLRYKPADPSELARLRPNQSIGALFHAEGDPGLLSALAASGATAYSYEFVEEDSRFPLATPGGEIAGIQAVLHGAQALQTVHGGRGVLLARVAGAAVPQVVVIGCGNVGAAAARTAAALGAEVTVLARTEASASRYLPTTPRGVPVVVNAAEIRRAVLAEADLVIGAILVSTFDTPPMITETNLRDMKTGAVVVDATCGYGDGYLPTAGPVQRPGDPPREVWDVLPLRPRHRGHPRRPDADPARGRLGGPGVRVGVDALGHCAARPPARRGRRRPAAAGDPAAVRRHWSAARGAYHRAATVRAHPSRRLRRAVSIADRLIPTDCLAGPLPADPRLVPGSFELITQFGLLGLSRDPKHFTISFTHLHRLLAPGGWTAGANWVARHSRGRVDLSEQLYRDAAARAGVHLLLLHRITSADPDFPAVWTYVGQTWRTP